MDGHRDRTGAASRHRAITERASAQTTDKPSVAQPLMGKFLGVVPRKDSDAATAGDGDAVRALAGTVEGPSARSSPRYCGEREFLPGPHDRTH